MIRHFEQLLGELAASQGKWSLTMGEPRITFYSDNLLPLWEIVEAFRETNGQTYRCIELAGPAGYFSGMFIDDHFVTVANGEGIVAALAEMKRAHEAAARALEEMRPRETKDVDLF